MVGTLRFRTTAVFSDTEIWLVEADLARDGQTETISPAVGVSLQVAAPPSPDFDGNGLVGFSDFVVFAGVFGSQRGDGQYVAAYDLNNDGAIGFEDFVVFASSFGEEANRAPTFGEPPPVTRTVEENTAAGEPVGDPVSATDADGDSLTYRLRGVHADSFAIASGTGQLLTKERVAYDHEAGGTYALTVRASDGHGGRATVAVDITVADEDEPPSAAPDSVRVASRDSALSVTWRAASDEAGKPPVSGYEAGHKQAEAEQWPEALVPVEGRTDTAVTITGLRNEQTYHVRVRTVNEEGTSPWSEPVEGVPTVGPRPLGELRDQTALIGRDLEISLASLFTRPAGGDADLRRDVVQRRHRHGHGGGYAGGGARRGRGARDHHRHGRQRVWQQRADDVCRGRHHASGPAVRGWRGVPSLLLRPRHRGRLPTTGRPLSTTGAARRAPWRRTRPRAVPSSIRSTPPTLTDTG